MSLFWFTVWVVIWSLLWGIAWSVLEDVVDSGKRETVRTKTFTMEWSLSERSDKAKKLYKKCTLFCY